MTSGVLYLDASAIVKLAIPEPESAALAAYATPFDMLASSVVGRVEVRRAVRRAAVGRAATRRVEEVLARITLIHLDEPILRSAEALEPFEVRTLDALHLASALALGDDVTALCTYDRLLARASGEHGIDVVAPS